MSKKEVAVIEREIAPLVAEAAALSIKTDADMKEATRILSQLNKVNDRIEAEEDKITVPLQQALTAERNRWKPFKLQYKGAIEKVRAAMSAFQTARVKEVKKEENSIANRIGEGRGKMKVETVVEKLGEIDRPDARHESTEGMVSFRTDKILKVVDASLIPRKYLMVDEKAVLAALVAGNDVPGAVVEEIQVPINKRK